MRDDRDIVVWNETRYRVRGNAPAALVVVGLRPNARDGQFVRALLVSRTYAGGQYKVHDILEFDDTNHDYLRGAALNDVFTITHKEPDR